MSREFFLDLLPRNKNNSKIEALEKVADWDIPPPKNTESNSTTEDVAQEASKYFSHLALPYTATNPAHAKKITKAQNKLLDELGKWGVPLLHVISTKSKFQQIHNLLQSAPHAFGHLMGGIKEHINPWMSSFRRLCRPLPPGKTSAVNEANADVPHGKCCAEQ